MTPRVSCPDIERLMLEGEDRELARAERSLVDDHLGGCEGCRAFSADRLEIRAEAAALRWPEPPDALLRKTRRLLLGSAPDARPAALPAWVLVAMALVAVATGLWLAVSLAGVTPDMTLADLPAAGLAAVLIIIQNALTLLFAPVVLRTVRARRGASESA
jgi:predicted anti-sigma-YlaC factor YlaD